ncbi:hypothetical protein PVAP13_9NG809000 [Panicum virgatum]|uniref:Pentatricopeptide repeat-containing protein n=1 Tax=Panicum virgatum TaxID=38727 RepID=A0A8T0N5A2_PANVG|nr:hypothetical protein PVAP13_9NG809000 [Panicum virgatum]
MPSPPSPTPRLPPLHHPSPRALGVSADTFTTNHLLIFYKRCGHLAGALRVFDEMPHRNLISWTAMVSGSVRNAAPDLGLQLFVSMLGNGLCPQRVRSRMRARCLLPVSCGQCQARPFRSRPRCQSWPGCQSLCGKLVDARHGRTAVAEHVFAGIVFRDLACWNAMLEAYISNGYACDAMRTVVQLHRCGITPDVFTYISAVKASSINSELNFGRQLHGLGIHNRFESTIFGKIRQKDTVSWNTVISGLANDEEVKAATDCFVDMSLYGCKPNQVTLSVMLRLCGAKENTSLGLQIFGLAYRHGYSEKLLVANAVINMLSRCGLLHSAYGFFSNLSVRNIMTWNEMIAGYGLHSSSEDVMKLFRSLLCFGSKPDEFTYPAVLSAFQQAHDSRNHEQIHACILKHGFASCQFVSTSLIKVKATLGSVHGSLKVIEDTGKMDLVSWGVTISAFLKHGLNDEALYLFTLFRDECTQEPDEFILATILNACANAALIGQCRCIHSLVVRAGYSKHFCVASALVDAYAKCGDVTAAESVFTDVSLVTKDTILYNTMLTAYANHGLIHQVLRLYREMEELQLAPTPATFVAVISACSHLGQVEEGKLLFSSMLFAHGVHRTRANYSCLVDLLARKGLVSEAKDVIEAMPFQPWPAVWRSLMNGCRIHGNKELGVLAAEQILRMAPSSDGTYVSLSNAYAGDGEWQSAEETRRMMAENQVQKVQAYSSVEI